MDEKRMLRIEAALQSIANEPCLWLDEKFNHGKPCRVTPPKDGMPWDTVNWCSVCIAQAALKR